MAAVGAGHAALDLAHRVAAAGRAGRAARGFAHHHHLGFRVGFQPHPLARDETDRDQVALYHSADRRENRGDVLPRHPSAAARVEHRLQLLDDKADVTAAPEHRRDHPRQRHGPGVMLHVFRIDEHLERAPVAALHDVIHRDVDRVFARRPFQLVGRALERRGAVERLGQIDHLGAPVGVGRLLRGLRHTQHRAGHVVRPVGGAALAAGFEGFHVDVLELLEGNVLGAVDRLRDRGVDPFLRRRLHPHMVERGEGLGVDEIVGQCRIALQVAPHLHGIIDDLLLGARAVLLQHLALVGIGEDRLDARADIARIKRDRPGGRDRGQQRVADTMGPDRRAHILVHLQHVAGGEVFLGVEERKGAFLLRNLDRGEIARPGDLVHPALGLRRRLVRAIAQPEHQQRVGQPGYAQTDAALVHRLLGLLRQREARGVDDVVHHPHRGTHQPIERHRIKLRCRGERIGDQPRQVDRAEQAGAIGRQRLLATGVGRRDLLAVTEVVHLVDAVDEDHARLGVVIGRAHDPVPQIARLHGVIDLAGEFQIPGPIGLHRRHEGIGHQNREVEHPQPRRILLRGHELLDVGVVAAHRRHHRAAARAGRHDRATHRVPDIHEGQRARGVGGDTLHLGAARADRREVIADAAALLHGQRGLLQHVEDARHAVRDRAHDEAVEEGHRAPGAGAREDAAGRQELEILERVIEALFPGHRVRLDRGEIARHTPPAVLDGDVDRRAIGLFQTVFHVPDLFGDIGGESGHRLLGPVVAAPVQWQHPGQKKKKPRNIWCLTGQKATIA
ncbi:hypothetical protein SDC9_12885 [bioreactor metagenome]|uniref:Uncharacterized protein n=1 Tax=bioreactor metagenome TaxID=1076179 RepID=A0A644TJL4_9ZZZZ